MDESGRLLSGCADVRPHLGFESRSLRPPFPRPDGPTPLPARSDLGGKLPVTFRTWRTATVAVPLLIGALVAVGPVAVCASPSGSGAANGYTYATPTEQYLALRHAYAPTPGLTPEVIAADPARWRGKTLELEGRLSGILRADGGSAVLMLTTDRYGSLELPMSVLPYWLQPGEKLRVLAVAAGDGGDTMPAADDAGANGPAADTTVTIGVAQMQVVCVASASDIAAEEMRWKQEADARARAQQEALRRAAASLARAQQAHGSSSGRAAANAASYAAFSSTPGHPLSGLSRAALAVYQPYRDFIWKHNKRLTSQEADAITSSVLIFSERYDVDPRLVIALIIAESDFDPRSTSNKGAMGLGQLMPDEAHDLGLTNPYDPVQNVAGAVYLLRGRLDHYSLGGAPTLQSIVLALASYNAGMGAVKKYGGVPPYRETQNYVKKITRLYQQLCAGDSQPSPPRG